MRDKCCWLRWVVFFKQKTADEMRISDWSSDVCSSDLNAFKHRRTGFRPLAQQSERIDGLFDDNFGAGLIEQAASLSAYARRLTGGAGADADDLLQDPILR